MELCLWVGGWEGGLSVSGIYLEEHGSPVTPLCFLVICLLVDQLTVTVMDHQTRSRDVNCLKMPHLRTPGDAGLSVSLHFGKVAWIRSWCKTGYFAGRSYGHPIISCHLFQ